MAAIKTIGILGGMGPAAGVDLLTKIIRDTLAETDQMHIPALLFSDSKVPDRTTAILHGGADPRPELEHAARTLISAGAELLLIACNTAHYYYSAVSQSVNVPVLHMPRETAVFVRKNQFRKVALLSTTGTIAAGVYSDAFTLEAPQCELLLPTGEEQAVIMDLIYEGVKKNCTNYDTTKVTVVLNNLRQRGAQAFILGCTELPIALSQGLLYFAERESIDPTCILARSAILRAGARLRNPEAWPT